MPRNARIYVLRLFAGCVLLGGVGAAASPKAPACGAEIQRFCGHIETGQGKLHRCLDEHRAQLSPTCASKLKQLEARRQAVRQLCAADAGKHCGHLQPGQGRVVRCLREHGAELSPACAGQLRVSP